MIWTRIKMCAPEFLKEYLKITFLRLKHPGRTIGTHLIGNKVRLGTGCSIARYAEIANDVEIGDYSYVNAGTVIASGVVGKFCSIGYYCQIGMHEHPIDYLSTSSRLYGKKNIFGVPASWEDFPSPPVIGHDVWVGSHAIVMQGVQVGHGAVIAGGAVVTREVAPYTIVGGIPAKEIRARFDPVSVDMLLSMKWWDWPMGKIRASQEIFLAGRDWRSRMGESSKEGGG